MAMMRINGADIYYELRGQGKPLVLIEGYACDHTFWDLVRPGLETQFQVLVFDNRGSGQTKDAGEPLTLEIMAADTMMLIDALGLVCPHILGHSMGGAIAQIMGRNHADKLGKLILMNSSPHFNYRALFAMESMLTLRKNGVSLDLLIEVSLPWFYSSVFLANPQNVILFKEILGSYPYLQTIGDQERQLKALQAFDSRPWLHEISLPVHVIAAKEDIAVMMSESEQLVAGIAGASLAIIDGGHCSPVEQAAAVVQWVTQGCC